ncbi:PREDICTED: uncharacterized protein LOC108970145 [Bactrocera latifrons]|uniref:uncharacterized protein LOC108970145 n=1 Tax=Bactrocera latifrons TaxID=174628 RepID=UPI0008DD9D23|nr:PREDICTED: uncharacterized protein LOC108970145 [Bactrocera latifrons]
MSIPARGKWTSATAVATAGVQRRRVINKHIQQKYLLCGFAIHAFLATPAYLYGNVVESDKDLVLRIWPAIVYQATGQICRSILEHLDTEYRGRERETTQYRRFFLCATLTTCLSLMISGVFFSSAWFIVSTTTQAVAIVFYGLFAGIGSSLFIWKTHVILEAVRPREDKFVRKTIHLCGEAFCQLFLSFVFTSLRTLYGTAQSIVLMSALLVNLIPISLIITRHREGSITKRISMITAESSFPPLHHQLGAFPPSIADQIDGIDVQMPRIWKSPLREQHPGTATAALFSAEARNNYMLAADEAYVTFVNPNGVEIMEIIPEEDETVSMIRGSSATIGKSHNSVAASQKIHPNASSNGLQQMDETAGADKTETDVTEVGKFYKFQRISRYITTNIWKTLKEKTFLPLQRALLVPRLYSTTLLMSADIFSYVMCLTVLPGLAVTHHAIKNAEIPFLFSLLAFPWMCFSLMTPRFGSSLYKRKIEWHTLGSVCKALALILISFSTSKLQLSVSSVLLGFGQAVTLFLQDVVFQRSMPRAQWNAIRYPVHFTNGLLMFVWGALAHWVVVTLSFQASVGLAGMVYVISMITWNMIFVCCNTRD